MLGGKCFRTVHSATRRLFKLSNGATPMQWAPCYLFARRTGASHTVCCGGGPFVGIHVQLPPPVAVPARLVCMCVSQLYFTSISFNLWRLGWLNADARLPAESSRPTITNRNRCTVHYFPVIIWLLYMQHLGSMQQVAPNRPSRDACACAPRHVHACAVGRAFRCDAARPVACASPCTCTHCRLW